MMSGSLLQVPGMADWPGLQLHSHNYRGSLQFQGMAQVLVVGASFSGVQQQLMQAEALLGQQPT